MELYFNPIKIEYVRDLMKQAMGRSNKAAHSFSDIKNLSAANGYPVGDGDFSMIEQELERLSALCRSHYDFLDSASRQYANAENKNIDVLSNILLEFKSLHSNGVNISDGSFDTANLDSANAFAFEARWQDSLLPVDLNMFSSVPGMTIELSTESIIIPHSAGEFIELFAECFNGDISGVNNGAAGGVSEINAVLLPAKDILYNHMPVFNPELKMAGLLLPGVIVNSVMRNTEVTKSIGAVGLADGVAPVLRDMGVTLPYVSLQGYTDNALADALHNNALLMSQDSIINDIAESINSKNQNSVFNTIDNVDAASFFAILNLMGKSIVSGLHDGDNAMSFVSPHGVKGNSLLNMSNNAGDPTVKIPVISKDTTDNIASENKEVVFKTIEDFFIYLARIKYLLDGTGIQIPPVASLQGLSVPSPVYSFDFFGGSVGNLTAYYQELSNILFSKKDVTIPFVGFDDIPVITRMQPLYFASGHYNSPYAPILNSGSRSDDPVVPTGEFSRLEDVLYALNAIQDTDEASRITIMDQYLTISRFLRDNFDENPVLSIVKTSRYLDIDEVKRDPIASFIFPGIRVTDEMSVNPFRAINDEKPVIHRPEQLLEQELDMLTIINDDGYLMQVPKVDIIEYGPAVKGYLWEFGTEHGVLGSVTKWSPDVNEALEISSVKGGTFTPVEIISADNTGDAVNTLSRTTAPYIDVDQMRLDREYLQIKDVAVTDYERIVALNNLEIVKEAMENKSINIYADKYKTGVDGLAADITQALMKTENNIEDTDIYVQGLTEALAINIIKEYTSINSKNNPADSQQDDNEMLNLKYKYDSDGDILVHGYIPQILSAETDDYKDITLNVYDSGEKTTIYVSSENIETDIDGIEVQQYVKDDIQGIPLYKYVPDEIPVTTNRNEGEALITNISQQAEADVKISVTKRLELWLKWLFEMSMKGFGGGGDGEELAGTVSRLKQKIIDDPVYSDVTEKSIKRFVENMDRLLNEYDADAQSVASITNLGTTLNL